VTDPLSVDAVAAVDSTNLVADVLNSRLYQFDNTAVTPAARGNDTTDIHLMAGGTYAEAGDFSSAQSYLHQAGQRAASLNQLQLMAEIQATLASVEQRLSR